MKQTNKKKNYVFLKLYLESNVRRCKRRSLACIPHGHSDLVTIHGEKKVPSWEFSYLGKRLQSVKSKIKGSHSEKTVLYFSGKFAKHGLSCRLKAAPSH